MARGLTFSSGFTPYLGHWGLTLSWGLRTFFFLFLCCTNPILLSFSYKMTTVCSEAVNLHRAPAPPPPTPPHNISASVLVYIQIHTNTFINIRKHLLTDLLTKPSKKHYLLLTELIKSRHNADFNWSTYLKVYQILFLLNTTHKYKVHYHKNQTFNIKCLYYITK